MITLAWVLPVMDLIVYRNDEASFRSAKLSSVLSKYNYHFLFLMLKIDPQSPNGFKRGCNSLFLVTEA